MPCWTATATATATAVNRRMPTPCSRKTSRPRPKIDVVNAAEKRNSAWAYWQFEGSFGTYDIDHGQWIGPIHQALVASDSAYSARDR